MNPGSPKKIELVINQIHSYKIWRLNGRLHRDNHLPAYDSIAAKEWWWNGSLMYNINLAQ